MDVMMFFRTLCAPVRALLFALLALAFAGCFEFTQEYPEKRTYGLDLSRDMAGRSPVLDAVLKVRRMDISDRFAGRALIYRMDDVKWEADFYNEFLVPPALNITEEVRRWLGRAKLFSQSVAVSSRLRASYVLEGEIHSLYGDFRERPAAVVEAQFFLLTPDSDLVFQRRYEQRVDLSSSSPEDLVQGFHTGLRRMLGELEQDLEKDLARSTPEDGDRPNQ